MEKLKPIEKITLLDIIKNPVLYSDIAKGLTEFPVPEMIVIGRKIYPVPADMDKLSNSICYGQRLYFTKQEPNDFGIIIRYVAGYFYPIYSDKPWNDKAVIEFAKKIIKCKAIQIYPVATHLINLMGELADREKKLLHREPTKIEIAAGIDKLNIFSELNALDFLRDAMKITVPEVLLTPYDECLVRFMNAKVVNDYQEKYIDLMKSDNKTIKSKYQK